MSKPATKQKPVVKGLGELLPDPEAGVHAHGIDRASGRTLKDGAHLHLFVLPDGTRVITQEDGQHDHALRKDGNQTESDGEHSHSVHLPDGSVAKTASEVSAHNHDLLVRVSGFDGTHTHTLTLKDGKKITSLTAAEFAALAQTEDEVASPGPATTILTKTATKTERGMSFPSGAYAYVPDATKPSTWKLRLFDRPQDVPDKPSVRLTAAAAQALSPSGFRGQPVQLPQTARQSVKRKVASAWLKARRDKGDQVSSDDLPSSLKVSKNESGLAVSLKLDRDGEAAFGRVIRGLPSLIDETEEFAGVLKQLAEDLVIAEKQTDVASLDIRQVVNDKLWQSIREAFVGTWKDTPEKNVARLRQYLGSKQSSWNPLRVRRVLNYLTGSAFRTGRISNPGITSLLTQIRSWWKVDENRMMKSHQEDDEDIKFSLDDLISDLSIMMGQIKDDEIKGRLSKVVEKVKKNFAVPQNIDEEDGEKVEKVEAEFRILKADEKKEALDEHTVLGEVLVPEEVDAQKDIYSADEIKKTAWKFMEQYQNFGFMHKQLVQNIKVLESYLAPVDFEINGVKIKKGTWLVRVRVLDSAIWKDIKSGKLTGFSIGGTAIRRPEPVGSKS